MDITHDQTRSTCDAPSRRGAMKILGAGALAVGSGLGGGMLWPSVAHADGAVGEPFALVNVKSRYLLDVHGGSGAAGAHVIQWQATGAANQEWVTTELADGWVTIACKGSGKVLDVQGASTDDGSQVIQWDGTGATNQQWRLEDAGAGRVRVVSRSSGKVLTVRDASAEAGATVEIRAGSGDESQLWTVVPTTGYRLDASDTEKRSDAPLAGAGAAAGGVVYGVTRNGWSRDGRAWYPVSGEFHYVRYPAHRWESELGKMRAAGVDIVATYVFWNHHEQRQGTWDWTGRRDLRAFVQAARRQGLLVWLRVGPYVNAEAENGGIPSFALPGSRTNDAGYLAQVGSYYSQIATQMQGMFVGDGGPVVGIQLENEFATGDPDHISTLRRMCVERAMVVPYYTVTANSNFHKDAAIPLQGAYCYRGWERDGGTSAVSGFIYGTDEWTANSDIGGPRYDTLDYPRGFCELGTGSPMEGTNRFRVERQHVIAHAYDSVGRGANYLGYYMFHGGTQIPGLSKHWPLTYDFQAPLGEFGQTRDAYRYYRRLHTFVTTWADELVRTRVTRDPLHIMNPEQTGRLRHIGRFDSAGRGFVFVNNTQRNVTLPSRDDMQIRVSTARGTVTLPDRPLTMPPDRCNAFPVMTDLGGVDLRWATVEPFARLSGEDVPTYVYTAPDWTDRSLAFDKATVVTGELGRSTRRTTGDELIVTVPSGRRVSLLVHKAAGTPPCARVIVLPESDTLNAAVVPLDGRDRLVVTDGAQLSGLAPTARFTAAAGARITADIFPAAGLSPGTGWRMAQRATPFTRYTYRLSAAPAAPKVTPDGTGRWRITSDSAALDGLAAAQLVFQYRGGDATLRSAGTPLTNDLYHGEPWTIDLLHFGAETRADLVLQVSAWDDAIHGIPRPTDAMPALAEWAFKPLREAAWK
ncbi:beta-galactosidase [Streptomyces sp. NPDC088789]|uniref:beta-galactosidase n=1 Tax=Streptomyces sp. NPDC088789 TaxID=3365899 RepID=UPI0037F23325